MGTTLSAIGSLVAVVAILFLAFWCTRFLGRTWNPKRTGRYLKVVEQMPVAQDKQILLIKAGEQSFLISVAPSGVTMLSELKGSFEDTEDEHG